MACKVGPISLAPDWSWGKDADAGTLLIGHATRLA